MRPADPEQPPRRIGPRQRRWVYATSLALWASGVGWLVVHHVLRAPDADPALPAPSEVWWLRAHGAALLAFLVTFGSLLPGHVRQGLRRHLNQRSGILLVSGVAVLAVTGYALYYVPSDALRPITSTLHWAIGLIAAPVLVTHAALGRGLVRRWTGASPHRHRHGRRGG